MPRFRWGVARVRTLEWLDVIRLESDRWDAVAKDFEVLLDLTPSLTILFLQQADAWLALALTCHTGQRRERHRECALAFLECGCPHSHPELVFARLWMMRGRVRHSFILRKSDSLLTRPSAVSRPTINLARKRDAVNPSVCNYTIFEQPKAAASICSL